MCMIRVWRTGAVQVGNSMMPVREGFSKQDRRSEKDGTESVWDWSCTKKNRRFLLRLTMRAVHTDSGHAGRLGCLDMFAVRIMRTPL